MTWGPSDKDETRIPCPALRLWLVPDARPTGIGFLRLSADLEQGSRGRTRKLRDPDQKPPFVQSQCSRSAAVRGTKSFAVHCESNYSVLVPAHDLAAPRGHAR